MEERKKSRPDTPQLTVGGASYGAYSRKYMRVPAPRGGDVNNTDTTFRIIKVNPEIADVRYCQYRNVKKLR